MSQQVSVLCYMHGMLSTAKPAHRSPIYVTALRKVWRRPLNKVESGLFGANIWTRVQYCTIFYSSL